MRTPRIHVEADLVVGAILELPSAQMRHVAQVLRLAVGDRLIVFNGDGYDYQASLAETERHRSTIAIDGRSEPEPAPPLEIRLAIGVSRGERMDFALQKAVELGVNRLTPIFTKRSQVKLDGARLDKRMEHWRGVVIAACEQSGRRRVPALDRATRFEDWLDAQRNGGLLLDPGGTAALADLAPPEHGLTLLIGPEGGFDPSERKAAGARGFLGVRLGPRILRTETAPLAAIAVIQALWGDFKGT
ncbi:16S rRNA (uracil(1498)-N(3))-methyltransferase [Thiorhodococcus mannitoliphagus]|uniref:Ribosomal RNA small subunit methyltransferase E n=1 Tax=Thiorhodococcus mannitoliphagus TaxID=329406 RepID=A0A6P1DZ20_9GAMM|nr:16S rRNA (uracil(1498)-N(3))-methyltransferase [Thiorhodococcus mannitoliphagus]NEX22271.1 16S rRNA (uracil(1498)-N(3))-methyltransferase [Thiorhodococcus mannitoliphagus]